MKYAVRYKDDMTDGWLLPFLINQVVRSWCFPKNVQLQETWDLLALGNRWTWNNAPWRKPHTLPSPHLRQALKIIKFHGLWQLRLQNITRCPSFQQLEVVDVGFRTVIMPVYSLLCLPSTVCWLHWAGVNICEVIEMKGKRLSHFCEWKSRITSRSNGHMSFFSSMTLDQVSVEGEHC